MILLGATLFSVSYMLTLLGFHPDGCCCSFSFSGDFIYKVSSLSPTKHFIIHSRKALLNGISPAENRSIPPLKYVLNYFIVLVVCKSSWS